MTTPATPPMIIRARRFRASVLAAAPSFSWASRAWAWSCARSTAASAMTVVSLEPRLRERSIMGSTQCGKKVLRNLPIPARAPQKPDCSKGFVTLARPRHPPPLERYEAARRLVSRVPGADPRAIETCLCLWRFSDEMSASFETFYAAHPLSSARGNVLTQLLESEGGLTPAQLAERAGTTPPSMTGLVPS